jgi:hypothetical protein
VNKSYGIIILLFLLNVGSVFSEDSITTFNEKFALNFIGNYNIGVFTQQETSQYRTNMPFDIGLGIRYKKVSAQILIPVSFNNLSFDFELNSYFEKIFFELFFKKYQYFYNEDDTEYNDVGLDIMATGITIGWIHNNKEHSLSSVFNLNRKQNKPSGSLLYGFGIFYTSIFSENKKIIHYNEEMNLVYFGPMIGYSYTWILPHDMFINFGINFESNVGINIKSNRLLFSPQIRPKFSFGHHNDTWSTNLIMGCNSTIIVLDKKNTGVLTHATITLSFSKRF